MNQLLKAETESSMTWSKLSQRLLNSTALESELSEVTRTAGRILLLFVSGGKACNSLECGLLSKKRVYFRKGKIEAVSLNPPLQEYGNQ
jgi:hypothetical protein